MVRGLVGFFNAPISCPWRHLLDQPKMERVLSSSCLQNLCCPVLTCFLEEQVSLLLSFFDNFVKNVIHIFLPFCSICSNTFSSTFSLWTGSASKTLKISSSGSLKRLMRKWCPFQPLSGISDMEPVDPLFKHRTGWELPAGHLDKFQHHTSHPIWPRLHHRRVGT